MKSFKGEIKMVDLVGQFEEIEPEIIQGIRNVILNSSFINGPQVKMFAEDLEKYTASKCVVPCGNGTDALQIALMGLDLKPGDEVIVPAFTYVATVEVIALLQLKPVFVDVNPDTFCIDVDKFENAISSKTKAVIVVHLFGQSAPMEAILNIANKNNLYLIEDNAQALGSVYTFSNKKTAYTGTMGTIGTTSFFPSKNLGAYGDGGALFTNDVELGERLRMIANHGQKRKYHHDIIGINSRLDTLQAAILIVKLKHLDIYTKKRNEAADYYDDRLANIEEISIPFREKNTTHVFHQYTLKVKEGLRNNLHSYLKERGIPSVIYYPLPQHLQKAYLGYGYKKNDFPVSERLCEEVLSLPIHTQMKKEEQEYICTTIETFFSERQ